MLLPFLPPPGLDSNDTTFSKQGRWADGSNVRFWQGKPQTVGGPFSLFTLPVGATCYDLFAFTRSGAGMIAYGQVDKLYVGTGLASPSDRTPASFPSVNDGWSLASWGNNLLAAPRGISGNGGTLYEQSGTGAAAAIAGAPARIDAGILVTAERQVLAFACTNEAGTHDSRCIRGSDLEDNTDWTSTSTNNAFEHILDGPGAIIRGELVGPYVAVWTTTALHLGQFVGNPGQTYRFDKVAEGCAPISQRAVCVVGGTAYWMSNDFQMRRWTPGGLVEIIPCPISQDFVANAGEIADQKHSFIVPNSRFQEIWYCYNDERDAGVNSRYIAISLIDGAWFRGLMAHSAMIDSEIVRMLSTSSKTGALAAEYDQDVVLHDIASDATISGAYIQSADQYLDESQRRVMIRSFIPDLEMQNADVTLTIFVRDRPRSAATTKGPFTISTSATKKDFRASGRIFAAKIGSSGGTAGFRLGKPLFDIVPLGER